MICCIGSRISFGLRSPPWLHRMINGSGLSSTNFFKPLAIRSIVFGANGRTARMPYFSLISSDVSKIEGHGRLKSICVYVPTYGFNSPAFTSSLVCRSVCWLWSYNRLAVTPRDHKESFAHSRRTIIGSNQLTELHFIAKLPKLLHKPLKCLILFCLNWMMPPVQWSPCFKFFYVFQHDHSRFSQGSTARHESRTHLPYAGAR